jgi:hypothetical protein
MIKDYQNKDVLAEMKRQVNAAAKISDSQDFIYLRLWKIKK